MKTAPALQFANCKIENTTKSKKGTHYILSSSCSTNSKRLFCYLRRISLLKSGASSTFGNYWITKDHKSELTKSMKDMISSGLRVGLAPTARQREARKTKILILTSLEENSYLFSPSPREDPFVWLAPVSNFEGRGWRWARRCLSTGRRERESAGMFL